MKAPALFLALALFHCPFQAFAQSSASDDRPRISSPPDSFFQLVRDRDRDAARQFYKKYLDVKGMPVVASGEVADQALERTSDLVTHLLAGRPDVLRAMVSNGMYLIIIGKDQVYTDMPEYRNHPNPAYQNERVRGTGGKPTSFGEENLLSLPLDRYDDESIGLHEFCHTIDGTLRSIDSTWSERKNKVFHDAIDKGLWKNTYAGSNPGEYWAEICQSYFDCNRMNNWNHGPIGTRELLKTYDPEGYELIRTAFKLSPEHDYHYQWLQKLPNITAPPPKFKIDPYYNKFTWAREFVVVGKQAGDEALLKANDIIRKMFAYRHDILKALINDGAKLVVLGRKEHLADLPECAALSHAPDFDALSRNIDYTPATKIMVVAEENLSPQSNATGRDECRVIALFAKALYRLCATRPVDPNWDNRGRDVQQYELRVKRLDVRFDEKLKQLFESAQSKKLWRGTPAVHGAEEYWTEGVLAYFDATGQRPPPNDAARAITSRESLKNYDPDFFELVNEVMAYDGHVDWRYRNN